MFRRPEKKTSTLEVRLSQSKKNAFMTSCEENGVTASEVVRTFIDVYLQQSRRMKLKQIARDIAMTFIRNPIRTFAGVGSALVASFAASLLIAAPGVADSSDQPIKPPIPVYPIALAQQGMGAECEARFNVSPEGYVETGIEADCTHPGFTASVISAVSMLRFEPKLVEGVAVRRVGVVYPITYEMGVDEAEGS